MESTSKETVVVWEGPANLADADTLLSLAQTYGTITDVALYTSAGSDLVSIRKLAKRFEEQRLGITRPMDDAKKKVMDLFRPRLETLEQAEKLIKRGMRGYEDAEKARAEAHRATQEARVKAEQEARDKLAQAQEQERAAAALATSGDAKGAAAAQELADQAHAQAIDSSIAATQVVAAPVNIPKVPGLVRRKYYRPRIVDKQAFIEHVACNPTLSDFLLIDTKATGPLQRMVDAMKLNLKLPGIEVYETEDPTENS
jgi:hypothetical protein